ncbi:serine-type D-Ala-D-Ala carboxypeptidase, partial [Yersinia pestis]|nr:serine-type D-Ala-D-Ala carboxypeptidase [Yersinia pestis]
MKRSVSVVIGGMLLPLAAQAAETASHFPAMTPPAIDAASYV